MRHYPAKHIVFGVRLKSKIYPFASHDVALTLAPTLIKTAPCLYHDKPRYVPDRGTIQITRDKRLGGMPWPANQEWSSPERCITS